MNAQVTRIIRNDNFIGIITNKNSYQATKLIISAGAWLGELMPGLHLPLTIERQVLYWFKNKNEKLQRHFLPANLPIYLWEYLPGKIFYGFPDLGDGIKVAFYHGGNIITPDYLKADVSKDEINCITAVVEKHLTLEAIFNFRTHVCTPTHQTKILSLIFILKIKTSLLQAPVRDMGLSSPALSEKFFVIWPLKNQFHLISQNSVSRGLGKNKILKFDN